MESKNLGNIPAELKVLQEENDRLRRAHEVAEESFRSLFHKSLDILLIVDDTSGEILEVNQTVTSILGYTEKDLVGEHFSMLFSSDTEFSLKENFKKVKTYGSVFVLSFRRNDGSECVMDLTATLFPWFGDSAILVTMRDVTQRVQIEMEREKLIGELQEAMDKIKVLRGLLPICAHCKKILTEDGEWQQMEVYVTNHSEAQFSHGVCPDCIKTHYPDFSKQ